MTTLLVWSVRDEEREREAGGDSEARRSISMSAVLSVSGP